MKSLNNNNNIQLKCAEMYSLLKKNILNSKLIFFTAFFYLILWVSILLLLKVNPYNLYKIKPSVYFIFLTSIFMFLCGYFISSIITKKYKSFNIVQSKSNILNSNSKKIVIIEIITMIILIIYFLEYKKLLGIYGADFSRVIRYEIGYLFSNSLEAVIYNWIFGCIISFYNIFLAYKIVNLKFKDVTFWLTLINILLYVQIGMGRFSIFECVIYVFALFCIQKFSVEGNTEKISIKANIKNILVLIGTIIGALVAGLLLTIQRLSLNSLGEAIGEFVKQIVIYFTGATAAFQHGSEKFFGEFYHTYGRLTFAGIDEVIGNILEVLGFNYEKINSQIGAITQKTIVIGPTQEYNAFYTANMNFYIDFGILGVIILSLLFGALIFIVTNNYVSKKDDISLIIYLYLFYCMVLTTIKWPFQSPQAWIFLGAWIIIPKIQLLIKFKLLEIKK